MNRINIMLRGLALLLLSYPLMGLALSTDRDQAINIQADKLDIDDVQHISIYQGNVVMQQGSLHIQADKVVLYFTPQNDLQRLEIEGSPATLRQLNEKQETVSGAAKKIIYTDNMLLLKLMGDAHFQSIEDTIDGEWITLNTSTEALQAGSKKGKNRVRMLIQPRQKSTNKTGNNIRK